MSEKVNNEGMTEEESAERTPEESETAGLEKPAEKEREEVEPRGHGKKRHHSSHHKKGKKHHHKGAEHAGDKKKAHHSHHKKSKGHHKARTEVEQVGHKKKRHHRHHHKKSHSHEKGRDPANEAADPKTADEADDEAEENEPPAEPPVEPPVEATVARPPKAKRAASNKAREDVRAAPKPPPVAEPGWPPGWLVQPPPHYIWEPSFIKFRTIDHVPHSGPRIFNTPDHFVLSGATSPVDWTIGNIITDNGTVLRRITELGPHHLWVVSQDRASPPDFNRVLWDFIAHPGDYSDIQSMPLLCMDPIRPLPMPYPRVEILGRYWERRWAAEPQHEMPEHRRLLRIFDQWAREAELLLTKWDERWTFWTYRRHRGLDSPYRQSWRTLDAQLKDHGRAFMDFQEIFCQRLWGTPASTTLQLQVFGEEFMVYSSEIGGPKRRWMAKGWNLFKVQLAGHLSCSFRKTGLSKKGLLTPSDKITLSAAREHVGIVLQSVLDGMREMNKGFPKKPLVPGTKTGWKFDFLAMPMDHCLSRLVGYLLNEALAKGFKVIFPRGAAGVAGARVVGQYPIVALAGGGAPWYFWQIQKEQPVTVVHLEGWGWHVVLDGIKERWCRFWLYRDGDEQFCVPASRREGWHFEVLGGWGNLNEAVESEVGEEWLRGAAERGEPAWAKRTLLEITYTGPTAVLALTKPPPKKM